MSKSVLVKIKDWLNDEIVGEQSVGGGCIANSGIVTMQSGKKYFLKQGFANRMFECEANGLKEIKKSGVIKVPEVILVDADFLLLEVIESGYKSSSAMFQFGCEFAQLHQFKGVSYGFYEDNYIGSTAQVNSVLSTWEDFYFENRLKFQYKLAEKNGYTTPELKDKFLNIENKLSMILSGSEEEPVLLHGDLWGGNYMIDKEGRAILIDPAVYYGHREVDLAMTKLFGGFSSEFYDGYKQILPLKDGYEYRENIYLLYHVLNHLNIFGTGYYSQAIQLMNYYI